VVAVDGAVVAAVVAGAWNAVVGVGAAVVSGVWLPPIGGWVSGGLVVGAPALVLAVVAGDGAVVSAVVEGAAVPVVVVLSPLRRTTVATPAPRTPTISTASAMPRSRLRWFSSRWIGGRILPVHSAASAADRRGPSGKSRESHRPSAGRQDEMERTLR
jgi:hypothetical protein